VTTVSKTKQLFFPSGLKYQLL